MRWAQRAASRTSWATSTTVHRVLRCHAVSSCKRRSLWNPSTWLNGSSSRSTLGRPNRARPMDRRCCSPPERLWAGREGSIPRPKVRIMRRTSRSSSPSSLPSTRSSRLSRTLRYGDKPKSCLTQTTPGCPAIRRSRECGFRPTQTSPESAKTWPASSESSVDLPEPEGP